MATADACAIGLPAELVFDGPEATVPIVLGSSGGFLESVDGGSSWRCQVDPSELRARSRNPGDLLWDHGLRSGLIGFRDAVARQEVAIDASDPRHLVRADQYGPPAYGRRCDVDDGHVGVADARRGDGRL